MTKDEASIKLAEHIVTGYLLDIGNKDVHVSNDGSVHMCFNCGCDVPFRLHQCPYKMEIDGNDNWLCNCCDDCRDKCSQIYRGIK